MDDGVSTEGGTAGPVFPGTWKQMGKKKKIVSPFCANTSADHSWLAAADSGHNISLFVVFLASLPGWMILLLRESHLVL